MSPSPGNSARSRAADMAPARRLDPFVLPAETRGRFRMLLVASLLLAANLGFFSRDLSHGDSDRANKQKVLDRYGELQKLNLANPAGRTQFEAGYKAAARELLTIVRPRLLTSLVFIVLFASAAGLIYLTNPLRVRWREQPKRLEDWQAPALVGDLRRRAASLGLPGLPIEWRSGALRGRVYGLSGRETLLLSGEPAQLEELWSRSPALQVIALHELAHVANRDASAGEKARSVWGAVVALVLGSLGTLAVLIKSGVWDERILVGVSGRLVANGWRFAILIAILYAIFAGVVRTRELYADWRVAAWGMGPALEKILRSRERRVAWWKRVLGWTLHPSLAERHGALHDPSSLFRASLPLSLVTGFLLAVLAASTLGPLIELWSYFSTLGALTLQNLSGVAVTSLFSARLSLPSLAVAGFILFVFGYLLTGALGVQVQREAIADMNAGERRWRYGHLATPAFLLALGSEAGLVIAPASRIPLIWNKPLVLLGWLGLLTLLTWLWLVYIRAGTRLGVGVGLASTPVRSCARLLFIGAFLLIFLYTPLVITRWSLAMGSDEFPNRIATEIDRREFLVYMLLSTPMMAFVLALAVSLFFGLAGLGLAGRALHRRRAVCPVCKRVWSGQAIGRSCEVCGASFSPWIYAR